MRQRCWKTRSLKGDHWIDLARLQLHLDLPGHSLLGQRLPDLLHESRRLLVGLALNVAAGRRGGALSAQPGADGRNHLETTSITGSFWDEPRMRLLKLWPWSDTACLREWCSRFTRLPAVFHMRVWQSSFLATATCEDEPPWPPAAIVWPMSRTESHCRRVSAGFDICARNQASSSAAHGPWSRKPLKPLDKIVVYL